MIAILNHINWKKAGLTLITHPVFIALVTTILIQKLFPPNFPSSIIHHPVPAFSLFILCLATISIAELPEFEEYWF